MSKIGSSLLITDDYTLNIEVNMLCLVSYCCNINVPWDGEEYHELYEIKATADFIPIILPCSYSIANPSLQIFRFQYFLYIYLDFLLRVYKTSGSLAIFKGVLKWEFISIQSHSYSITLQMQYMHWQQLIQSSSLYGLFR